MPLTAGLARRTSTRWMAPNTRTPISMLRYRSRILTLIQEFTIQTEFLQR